MLSIVLKVEDGELGRSAYQLCGPHLSKRQILLPVPKELRKGKCLQLFS